MNIERLKELENNTDIIKKYVGISSFGKNRIIYLPLIIGIGLLLFIAMTFLSDLVETVGFNTIIILTIISIICFVLVKLIANATKKKLLLETKSTPICVAKIVAGNSSEQAFYCIYTTSDKRHDIEFIDHIVEKIDSAIQSPQSKIEKEVSNLFRPDFIKPNEFGKIIPLEFTENIEVWRKQVLFASMPKNIKEQIKSDNDKFAMIALVPENARFLFEYYN